MSLSDVYNQDPNEVVWYKKDWTTDLASIVTTGSAPTISSAEFVVPSALTVSSSVPGTVGSGDGISYALIAVATGTETTHTCAIRVTLSDSQILEEPFKIRVKSNNEG